MKSKAAFMIACAAFLWLAPAVLEAQEEREEKAGPAGLVQNSPGAFQGYTLVAPRKHLERVTGDFTREEYLALQALIYRVSEALSQVVPTERVYILSLGSQQANSHVHWHIAPLPPGVPLEEQQFEALRMEKGVLTLSEEEMAALAARIREKLDENLEV